jgi:ABC-type transport system involved in multi-copper enzyme maturation permease subunit
MHILLGILAFFLAPPIVTVWLRRSNAVWGPSILLFGLTFYLAATAEPEQSSSLPLPTIPDIFFVKVVLVCALVNLSLAALVRRRAPRLPAANQPDAEAP